MRHILVVISLVPFLAGALLTAKNDKDKEHKALKQAEKSQRPRKDSTKPAGKDRDRRTGSDEYPVLRRTEGHRPQDLNGDGRITRKEWPGNDTSFKELDRNGDGVITDYDRNYNRSTRQRNTYSSGARRNQTFKQLDSDGDGRISPHEWNVSGRDFNNFDKNRDGLLTRDEYR